MSKVILSIRNSNLINNALTTIAGENALDAAMGKTLQDSIDNKNSLKIQAGNEMNIAYGTGGNNLWFNYRGTNVRSTSISFGDGFSKGDLTSLRAKDFSCLGPGNRTNSLANMSPTITFDGYPQYTTPAACIKALWGTAVSGLPDGIYPCIVRYGNIATGIIQTTSSNGPTYGAVLLIGYELSGPFFMTLYNGVWSK